jgi:hypothetical protein
MPTDDAVLAELRRMTSLLELAFKPQLDAARESLHADPLNSAIFKATRSKWVGSGALQRQIKGHGGSTVRGRLAELADRGLLERRGDGPAREYRSSGLA